LKKINIKPEWIWIGIESGIILTIWSITQNFAIAFMIKVMSMCFYEEFFYAEVAWTSKRVIWNLLSLVVYVLAFFIREEHLGVFVWIKLWMLACGVILDKIHAFPIRWSADDRMIEEK
jgi:hypothetical protein